MAKDNTEHSGHEHHDHSNCNHNHEEIQEDYMKLQMLGQQLTQTQKQIQSIEEHIVEMNRVKEALDDIKAAKPGVEILVPLSSGIFVKAKLVDNNEVTVNVGSGVASTKSIEDTKALIDEQLDDLTSVSQNLMQEFQTMSLQAKLLQENIQKHNCE
jgi:prefoldin alpha subunit